MKRWELGLVVAVGLVCAGVACAQDVEDFDSLPAGTTLTSTNMPGWEFKGVLGGNARIEATNTSSASSPNAIRCKAEWGHRGAMFHSAGGMTELTFSFLRQRKPLGGYYATAEVGLATNNSIDMYNGLDGPRVVFWYAANPNSTDIGFFTVDANGWHRAWTPVVSDNTWHDGLIRLETDGTVTFGVKALGASDYTLSTGHALPTGFNANYVGAALYNNVNAGRAYLDNISVGGGCQLDVVRWYQDSSSWSNDEYSKQGFNRDGTRATIASKGCALTCLAMALDYAKVHVHPGALNLRLIVLDGYTYEGTMAGDVVWRAVHDVGKLDNRNDVRLRLKIINSALQDF